MIDRRRVLKATGATFATFTLPSFVRAADAPLRVASVKYGSLSWVLETVAANGLADKAGLPLQVVEVASNQAGPIALLTRRADVIVSDWPWAMRQRSEGEDFKFSPYSSALGALVVPKDSNVQSIEDLKGAKLGVAGSKIDKSWLLLQAFSQKTMQLDLASAAVPRYGAPPLLAEELRLGRIDANLNFWTFVARLEGSGYRAVVTVADVMKELGLDPVPSLVGFVWRQSFEDANANKVGKFLKVMAEANNILLKSDDAWERLRPLIRPKSDEELAAIKKHFRSGIPQPWGAPQQTSAEALFKILVTEGGDKLMGRGTKFDPGLFRHAAS